MDTLMINISFLKQERGFTMTEMLMVTVIIGMLAAILLPNFTKQRPQAKITGTKANLENLRTAFALYKSVEGVYPDDALTKLYDGTSPSGSVYIGSIPYDLIGDSNAVTTTKAALPGGWFLDKGLPTDYHIEINLTGMDANGTPYYEY